jgi:hypothetical protein
MGILEITKKFLFGKKIFKCDFCHISETKQKFSSYY